MPAEHRRFEQNDSPSEVPVEAPSELRVPEKEKLEEILALAELGKNAKITFHDLSNHITSLTLSLEHIANLLRKQIEESMQPEKNVGFSPFNELSLILKRYNQRATRDQINVQLIRTETNSIKKSQSREILLHGSLYTFRHIMENIISNAFDSFGTDKANRQRKSRSRQIKIHVGQDGRAKDVCVSVSDNGCGIPEKYQSKIFEESFTTKKHGHGIGLYMTKKLIEEKFDGYIQTKSSPAGSEFVVVFPTKKVEKSKNIEASLSLLSTERLRDQNTV